MNELIRTNNETDIFIVLNKLKDSFFNSCLEDDCFLIEMSKKFSEKAYFYYYGTVNEPEAFIAFYANDFDIRTSYISMIIVARDYQGKGLGKKLIEKMISVSLNNNMKRIKLEVNKENIKAIKFYEHLGFIKTEEETKESFFYIKNIGE